MGHGSHRAFPRKAALRAGGIDNECERIVMQLLSKVRGRVEYPIVTDDLEKLIESKARDLDMYADLSADGPDVEGVTRFARGVKPARCGARRRGETAKLGSAPCLPSKTSKPYPAIRPASAQASPKGPGRQLTVRTHRQRARASHPCVNPDPSDVVPA